MAGDATFAEAVGFHRRGDFGRARRLYDQVLKRQPRHFEAARLLALATLQDRQAEKAVRLFRRALAIDPDSATTHGDLGAALAAIGRHEAALESYDQALVLAADRGEIRYRRANTLSALQRFDEAIADYDAVLARDPRDLPAQQNRSMALSALGRHNEALAGFAAAIRLDPRHPIARYNHATALKSLGRLTEALDGYSRAIALQPGYADAYFGRANVLRDLKRIDAALADYTAALALAPGNQEIHLNCGNMLAAAGRYEAALEIFAAGQRHCPDADLLREAASLVRFSVCDWSDFEPRVVEQAQRIGEGRESAHPSNLVGFCGSPGLLRLAAEHHVARHYPANPALGPLPARAPGERIRVGYFSADFHEHATTRLIAELFELHDRAAFEIIAVSFGPEIEDVMRQRLRPCFSCFIEAGSRSDREIASLARELDLDVAVDLKGHTADNRLGCFAYRMAPVQVGYLGNPGTVGAGYLDYIIADATLIPEADRQHFSEKIVHLPDSYQPNDRRRFLPETPPARADLGLPAEGAVFCCFNNNYKILPPVFDAWVRILTAVPDSVLWLLEDTPLAARNLRAEASRRGLDPDRLVFAPRAPLAEHLARHACADLFLDTLPCNAHTTASDALWSGLPLLTCLGTSFAGRVAASLLTATGLPELVTTSLTDYERLAIDLARDPARLARMRAHLVTRRLDLPLFDSPRYTRHLEAAYVAIIARQRAGLPPDHLTVPAGASP